MAWALFSAGLGWAAWMCLAEPPALDSAPPPNDVPEVAGVVLGVIAGDPTFDRPAFAMVLREHLVETGFDLAVETAPSDSLLSRMEWAKLRSEGEPIHAVFWLEPVGEGHRLYLLEPKSEQLWVRALPQAPDAELAFEQVGLMVRNLVSTLGDGADVQGLAPVPAPEPVAEPAEAGKPAPPSPLPAASATKDPAIRGGAPAGRSISVGAEYVGSNLDRVTPWHHGAGGFLEVEFATRGFARLSGAFVPRLQRDVVVETTIRRLPFRLEGGYRFAEHRRIRPEVGGGLTAEFVWWEASDAPGIRGIGGARGRLAVLLGGGLRVRIWRGLGAHLQTHLEVWVVNLALVADLPGSGTPVLEAHPVSGLGRAGFHYVF